MARRFRVYEKKRGHRTTAPRRLAGAWEALFFAGILAFGCVLLLVCFRAFVLPDWRVNNEFVEGRCVVREKRIREKKDPEGSRYRLEIQVDYRVDGKTYRTSTYDVHSLADRYTEGLDDKVAVLQQFQVGQAYRCWYDPDDPSQVVLTRGYRWWVWLALATPLSCVMIGGGGLVYRLVRLGTSAERRAARARPSEAFPNVPSGETITDSPGTKLAWRLAPSASPRWTLGSLLALCIFFNGLVLWFLVPLVAGYLDGRPDWWTTLFLLPFIPMGVWLVIYFVRYFLRTNAIGPTLLEVSAHPLVPGQTYQLFLAQPGRLRVHLLRVLLVCEERAVYRQGTNTRSETARVFEEELYRHEEIELRPGSPFDVQREFAVPASAMHSFKSDHNEVTWKLLVRAEPAGWPAMERAFPIVVCPLHPNCLA